MSVQNAYLLAYYIYLNDYTETAEITEYERDIRVVSNFHPTQVEQWTICIQRRMFNLLIKNLNEGNSLKIFLTKNY